jgi:nickel transport protein
MNLQKLIFLIVILAIIPAGPAVAHKVILFAWVEDGMIHTESSFGSKRKAQNCTITVVDETGQVVHTGQTDLEGNHSFAIPENRDSDLILTLDAGIGHQAQWKISKKELITLPSVKDIQTAMKKKETLEQGPSVFKIIGGIGIIFLLALGVKLLKRKTS